MEVITIINQKGGVGKTTTVNTLGAYLHSKGKKVLYIDLDSQSNLTYSLEAYGMDKTILDVLTGEETNIENLLFSTKQGDIIGSNGLLVMADIKLKDKDREFKLKKALDPIKQNYDYILIDTAPALNILTINALATSDKVLITAQADIFSLQGIGQLYDTINTVKKHCNESLEVAGILLTRYNKRTILTRDITDMLSETAAKLNTRVFDTKIRECIAVKEAQAYRQDLLSYNKRSNASKDYIEFIKELGL